MSYQVHEPYETIATIPIGYAGARKVNQSPRHLIFVLYLDGYSRSWSNRGKVRLAETGEVMRIESMKRKYADFLFRFAMSLAACRWTRSVC